MTKAGLSMPLRPFMVRIGSLVSRAAEPRRTGSRSGSSPGQVAAPPCGKTARLPAFWGSGRRAAAAGTLLHRLAASWLCTWRSAAPHLSRLGPTRMRGVGVQVRGVGVRPGPPPGEEAKALRGIPSQPRSFGEPRDWEPNRGYASPVAIKLFLGVGRKAVNTVASGGVQESSSHRYDTLDSSIMVRLFLICHPP